jgi:hypothetical protein
VDRAAVAVGRRGHLRLAHRLAPGEGTVAFVLFGVIAVAAQWALLTSSSRYYSDAAINLAWMRSWQDGSLFQDPMTEALRATGFPPLGARGFYMLASQFGDPIVWAEWLGVVLAAASGWLVFRIVRTLSDWRPAPWLAGALFIAAWDIIRVRGGFPHSFAHVIILATVALLLARRPVPAAVAAASGALFYPPAALIALAIVVVTSVRSIRPVRIDRLRFALGLGATAAAAAVLRLSEATDSSFGRAEARSYPEFGPEGGMQFFLPSALDLLRNNYTGFDLRASGSILLIGALVLLAIGRVRLPWEVWAMPATGLALFAAAYAFLFHLYLPSRYTYPLVPFSAIAIGVSLHPAAKRLAGLRPAARLVLAGTLPFVVFLTAVSLFPLGVTLWPAELGAAFVDILPWVGGLTGAALVGIVLARRRSIPIRAATVIALLLGSVLLAQMAWAGEVTGRAGYDCPVTPAVRFIASLPPDTIVAGEPEELTCIPLSARRPVVISKKQFQPLLGRDFFLAARERLRVELRAAYGDARQPILLLHSRYGADVFLVTPRRIRNPLEAWLTFEPWRSTIADAQAGPRGPAALRLPDECVLFRGGGTRVYDLDCVSTSTGGEALTGS